MATYYGLMAPKTNLYQAANLSNLAPTPLSVYAATTDTPGVGVWNSSRFSPKQATYGGVMEESLWGVLKNKVIIYPTRCDLGSIVDTIEKTVEIWNTHAAQATLEEITTSNSGQGVTISGVSAGDVLDGLHGLAAKFTIARFGTLTVNTKYNFEFDLQSVFVVITGTRGIVLVDKPLINGYSESMAWQTEIFVSENGREHRAALMDADFPRRTITFPFKIGRCRSDRYASIDNIVTFGLKYAIFVPLWHSLSRLTADASGASIIYCNTSSRDFDQVNKIVIVSSSDNSYVVRNISSLSSSSIATDQGVNGFKSGDFVLPIIAATPEEKNSFEFNVATGSGRLKFTEVDE